MTLTPAEAEARVARGAMTSAIFRLWMQRAQQEIASGGGELKPARVIYATADPDKIRCTKAK